MRLEACGPTFAAGPSLAASPTCAAGPAFAAGPSLAAGPTFAAGPSHAVGHEVREAGAFQETNKTNQILFRKDMSCSTATG